MDLGGLEVKRSQEAYTTRRRFIFKCGPPIDEVVKLRSTGQLIEGNAQDNIHIVEGALHGCRGSLQRLSNLSKN